MPLYSLNICAGAQKYRRNEMKVSAHQHLACHIHESRKSGHARIIARLAVHQISARLSSDCGGAQNAVAVAVPAAAY